jgi:hypothetical protein
MLTDNTVPFHQDRNPIEKNDIHHDPVHYSYKFGHQMVLYLEQLLYSQTRNNFSVPVFFCNEIV